MPVRQVKQRMGGPYEAPSRATFWPIQRAAPVKGAPLDSTAVCVAHTETRGGERHVVVDDLEVHAPRPGADVSLVNVERRVEGSPGGTEARRCSSTRRTP